MTGSGVWRDTGRPVDHLMSKRQTKGPTFRFETRRVDTSEGHGVKGRDSSSLSPPWISTSTHRSDTSVGCRHLVLCLVRSTPLTRRYEPHFITPIKQGSRKQGSIRWVRGADGPPRPSYQGGPSSPSPWFLVHRSPPCRPRGLEPRLDSLRESGP